jgi:hypothetical protein
MYMQMNHAHSKALVLVAVLVTISMLTLLLTGAVADVILMMRSNNAYWQSSLASRQCEQLAAHAYLSRIEQQRLLNRKPCAMVWPQGRDESYLAVFFTVNYDLTTPQRGMCEVTVAKIDKQSRCLTPTVILRPGLQSWRWLAYGAAPT